MSHHPSPPASGPARRLDGRATSARVLAQVREQTAQLAASGIVPGIAVVIVGDDPASQVYVAAKARAAEECGFRSFTHRLPAETAQEQVLDLVRSLNAAPDVHGILVQLPLPSAIDASAVIDEIAVEKDVDGFHPTNVGLLGAGDTERALVPCTPAGCMLLIESVHGRDLSGLSAVVVGRSSIVGKPMASLLLAANATITVAHSRTPDLAAVCRRADILVAAVGRPHLVSDDWVKPGATVIDVGINRVSAGGGGASGTKLVGDVEFDRVSHVAGAITPVPGGVGPMTIALLMANTLKAARRASRAPVRVGDEQEAVS